MPPKAPTPCQGVPSLGIACARLIGVVGPVVGTRPAAPANNFADVRLIQQLINIVVSCGYVENSVLGGGNGRLATLLNENGQWSPALFNAIRQIELLYFHGRANPHGIGVIDPQADESLFTFLVALANGSDKARTQLSLQMKALGLAMVPGGRVLIDAGGTAPNGSTTPQKIEAIDVYLPGLLDALTKFGLNDTDMVLVALATVRAESSRFVPESEPMYDLNTPGTYTDKKTGATWSSDADTVHREYRTLIQHYKAVHKLHTETWQPNAQGVKGDIYDSLDSNGQLVNDLGNTEPGDGWKYRGRGLIQLTGRSSYQRAGRKARVGSLFVDDPDLVNSTQYAGVVVAGFLSDAEKTIRAALKRGDLAGVRKAVNGGVNGLDAFIAAWRAGSALISHAVIEQARAAARRRRTHPSRKKHHA